MRPTRVEISKTAFRKNLEALRQVMPKDADILAVVKADAYGHSAAGMARLMVKNGITRFGVATIPEALELRQAGINGQILLLQGPFEDYELCIHENLTPVFSDLDSLREWAVFLKAKPRSWPCHLKLDTGMGRLGFLELEPLAAYLHTVPHVLVEGVMTHFAVADEADDSSRAYTTLQGERFLQAVARLKGVCPQLRDIHCANSALTLRQAIPDGCRELVRLGLALYGVAPQNWLGQALARPLVPLLTWKTAIHSIKSLPTGYPVSYGRSFVATRPSRIAVLPVGYADGYPRSLSNKAEVLVHGRRSPVVGRVCMDLTMIDVTDIPDANRGDEVVLLGEQGDETLSVSQLAEWAGTIPYEIFCGIGSRVERAYV